MKASTFNRRKFIRSATAATSAAGLLSILPGSLLANKDSIKPDAEEQVSKNPEVKINFSVIGINHNHINAQVDAVIRGGGQFVSFHAKEDDLAAPFSKKYPQAKRVNDE